MATLEIKDKAGKTVGKFDVKGALAEAQPVAAVLHRAVVAEEANSRQGTQSAKTRSEVRGGGRKPYRQKKTGNARQGTIRAPHYAHGGMALAVKPRDYEKKLNKRERRSAILGAFKAKMDAGNISVVDAISFATPKTKDAIAMLTALGVADSSRILVIMPAYDEVTFKCFRNLPNVEVRTAPDTEKESKTVTFSTRDLLVARQIVIAKAALEQMEKVWSK
ncbi:MAG TPA: 50S ribosomal protein L4 [Fimbriimonadaceae bacterium]|nr:50S ribosomal protein L4 [Fimbriimonadaceae bacterium]HRJ97275.1 50S ribosomal protein L4 [Fimbriimonadaceae bacterium]